MRQIEKKALIISLCITLLLALFFVYYSNQKANKPIQMAKVIIATKGIQARTIITNNDIAEINIPKEYVLEGTIIDKTQVVGKLTRESIFKGEQILTDKLMSSIELDGVSLVIKNGYRAITLKVDATAGVGGNIKEGDFIDILVYIKSQNNDNEFVKTVFQSIEVLHILGKEPNEDKYLTLIMEPKEAEKLFLASEIGKLKLTLRPIGDKEITNLQSTNTYLIK